MNAQFILKSTSTTTLHDRFTSMLGNRQAALTEAVVNTQPLGEASLKNQRLAQQMANWPSVQVALQNRPSLRNRLGTRNVQARLGRPSKYGGMGGMARQWDQLRGRGSVFPKPFGMKNTSRLQYAVSDLVNYGAVMQQQHGAHVSRAGKMQNRGFGTGLRGRGTHGGFVDGNWTGRRGRAASRPVPTQEELDKQLDDYMSMSKSHLDAQLDAYMAEVDSVDML